MSLTNMLGLTVDIDPLAKKALDDPKTQAILIVGGDKPGIIRIPHTPSDKQKVASEFTTLLAGMHAVSDRSRTPTRSELVVAWMIRAVKRAMLHVGTKPLWDFTWDHGYLFLEDTGISKVPGRNPPNVFYVTLDDARSSVRPFYVG